MFTDPPSGGKITGLVDPLTIAAGVTITHVGVYDQAVDGNLILTYELPSLESYVNEGELAIDSVVIRLR